MENILLIEDFKVFFGSTRNQALCIKQRVSSVEHPQTNGQVKTAKKIIPRELRKKHGSKKDLWAEEILGILWAYHCMPQSSTGGNAFSPHYGADAIIPRELGETI